MMWILGYVVVVIGFWFLVDLATRDWTSDSGVRRRRDLLVSRLLSRRQARREDAKRQAQLDAERADPFVALHLQIRLAAVASEIRRLEQERHAIAVAHHLRASQYAYDALLSEACRLAGLDGTEPGPPPVDDTTRAPGEVPRSWTVDEDERMRQELELGARGWSW